MARTSERMQERIKEHLDKLAERDEYFALSYEQPNKSIEECCDFIVTQVQKMNVAGLDDDDVFNLAVHYYQEDEPGEISKGAALRCNVVVNRQVELSEEEIAAAKQRAIDDLVAAEKKKVAEKERREKERAKAEAEKRKQEEAASGLMSLFD